MQSFGCCIYMMVVTRSSLHHSRSPTNYSTACRALYIEIWREPCAQTKYREKREERKRKLCHIYREPRVFGYHYPNVTRCHLLLYHSDIHLSRLVIYLLQRLEPTVQGEGAQKFVVRAKASCSDPYVESPIQEGGSRDGTTIHGPMNATGEIRYTN
jgi:hypothetical protein